MKKSFYLNILIVVLTLFATISMLTGFTFMDEEKLLTATRIEAFKFFTVDSNVFVGIAALIFAVYEYKKKQIPRFVYLLKYIGTLGVTITFLVTLLYLGPFYGEGLINLYKDSNFFFHLVIPVLSFISFIFYEKSDKIKFKDTIYSLIPILLYAAFYVINVLTHGSAREYDFYNFTVGGRVPITISLLIVFVIIYLIDLLVYYLYNRRFKWKR